MPEDASSSYNLVVRNTDSFTSPEPPSRAAHGPAIPNWPHSPLIKRHSISEVIAERPGEDHNRTLIVGRPCTALGQRQRNRIQDGIRQFQMSASLGVEQHRKH